MTLKGGGRRKIDSFLWAELAKRENEAAFISKKNWGWLPDALREEFGLKKRSTIVQDVPHPKYPDTTAHEIGWLVRNPPVRVSFGRESTHVKIPLDPPPDFKIEEVRDYHKSCIFL